jgi:glycosyltransferase involved in cell wall biosynthesis
MRVAIDAIPLLVRSAGVKNYLYHWTRHLQELAGDVEIDLFPFLNGPHALDHEKSAVGQIATWARLGLLFGMNRVPFHVSGWIGPRADVFHTCKVLDPPRRAKLTATLHDLTCWLLPETHSPANVLGDKRFAERILKRADGIIAVSEATRVDAIRILGIPEKKIRTIYSGVAGEFFRVTPADAEAVRSRHGLNRPYLLFVGTIEPRKNVETLLDAYGDLPASIREEFQLVLAGPPGWATEKTLARLRQPGPGIRYLGYVAEPDIPGLFAGATVFVYPSLYEGFGFPIAQAMAAGAPVIASAVSAMPEIVGEAGVLIDPRSRAELRDAMHALLTSLPRRMELIRLGRINARRFSWATCARESQQFFRDVAGQ